MWLNIPRVKAKRTLEQSEAIGLALSGDPEEIGRVMIRAGQDPRAVGKWVQKALIEKRTKELEMRRGHGD